MPLVKFIQISLIIELCLIQIVIVEAVFSFILILMGILFFAFGFGTFILSIGAIGSASEGVLFAGQYMILGVLLAGGGIYINNKRGWGSK